MNKKELCKKILLISPLRRLNNDPKLMKGIHFDQFPILDYVSTHEGCTQKQVADDLHVSAASIALSTKRLQNDGMLLKQVNQNNLRENTLALTDEGKAKLKSCVTNLKNIDNKMFEGFTEDEMERLSADLDRIVKNLLKDTKFSKLPDSPFELH